MVNILRRFSQPIMIIVTLFVIITFAWWGPSQYDPGVQGSAATVIRGREISMEAFQRETRRLQVYARIGGEYFLTLDPAARMGKISRAGVENALIFEEEADALGVTATAEEMEDVLSNRLPVFQGADRKFDPAMFERFVQGALNPEGFSKGQFEDFLRGEVRIRKVRELLASAYPATPLEVKEEFFRQRLSTEASYVLVPSADLRKDQKCTEDEIKQRYEAKKDFLKTAEKRKVRFAAFTLPATPADKPLEESQRTERLQALANTAYDFAALLAQPGADFDELAKKAGATIGETAEFFAEDAGPPELEASEQAAEAAFKLTKEKPYSAHIALKTGTFVLALKEVKPPEQLTLDVARKQLEDELLDEKADTAMRKRAEELRGKLAEARKAGKSFADAAQALALKAEPFPVFSLMQQPPPGTKYSGLIQSVTRKLAPGEISGVIPTPGAALIVHVDQRPAVDEKGIEESKKEIEARIEAGHGFAIFRAWLAERRQAAGVKDSGES